MKRKKKVVILSAILALVMVAQAVAFVAVGHNGAAVEEKTPVAGVTREVLDAKPESSVTVVDVSKTAEIYREKAQAKASGAASESEGMTPVTESIAPQDVEEVPQNVRVLSQEETEELVNIAEEKIAESDVDVEEGEIVVIPEEELPEELQVKNLGAGIAYDPSTGLLYGVDGHGLLYIGFDYDSNQRIFYNPKYPWQRNFGFCEIYDVCAPVTMMFYDTQRFKFDYDGKNWMIQVWKGQYGITSGAEIGIYTKAPDRSIEFYDCASDEDCLAMSYDLMKNGEIFFTRESDSHWWLTGFAPLTVTAAEDFEMRAKITTKDETMAAAFAGALEENGYVLGQNYWVDGAVVSFNW